MMSRAVFTVAHGVVREHENGVQFHDRGEPYRRTRVVAEDKKGSAECPDFGQRKPIHNRGHRVLANAEMKVLSARSFSLNISRAREGQSRSVRGSEVCGSPNEPWDVLRERVQRLARGV